MPEIMYGLEIATTPDQISYRLRFPDGTGTTVSVPAISRESVTRLMSLAQRIASSGAPVPMSRHGANQSYHYDYVSAHDAVYLQYNACLEDKSNPMSRFVEEVFSTARSESVEAIVVDLRRNGGGDSRILKPFIDSAARWREQRGEETRELYVLIGRRTFSSAILNAIELKQRAGAIFVGEATGGRPNHFGEIKTLELPVLNRSLTYSTKYFETYRDGDPDTLYPGIPAAPSIAAYVQGRDPALEAVWEDRAGGE